MQHTKTSSLITGAAAISALMASGLTLPGLPGPGGRRSQFTTDEMMTFDQATIDSAGAFLIGQLERFDPMVHAPLVSTTWSRDIDLRPDVQYSDDTTSYTTQTFAAVGGANLHGINWTSRNGTAIPRVQIDVQKVTNDVTPWDMEVSYTVKDLAASERLGTPIDTQQLEGLNLKHQMDIDQLVYIGDAAVGAKGLLNHSLVVNVANVATNAAATSTRWALKTPAEILADFNEIIVSVWASTGYTTPPQNILVAPIPFGYIVTTIISTAGNQSILNYVKANNILTAEQGIELDIKSCKWLDKNNINGPTGSAATYDRMVAYTRNPKFVRFPMTPLLSLPAQYRGVWIAVPYYGSLGRVECVYPETVAFRDGIN